MLNFDVLRCYLRAWRRMPLVAAQILFSQESLMATITQLQNDIAGIAADIATIATIQTTLVNDLAAIKVAIANGGVITQAQFDAIEASAAGAKTALDTAVTGLQGVAADLGAVAAPPTSTPAGTPTSPSGPTTPPASGD